LRGLILILLMLTLIPSIIVGQKNRLISRTSSIEKIRIDYLDVSVKAYKVKITSTFNQDLDKFFSAEMNPKNTLKVTKPLAYIKLIRGQEHEVWEEGFTYEMRIKSMGIFPIGGIHHIFIEDLDTAATRIQTREHNNIAKVWDHLLSFKEVEEGQTEYTDEVILYARNLSWIFARYLRLFYKMRHKKWNKLLNTL